MFLLFVWANSLLGQKNGVRFFIFPTLFYNYIDLGYERHLRSNQTIELEAQAGFYFYIFNEETVAYGRLKASYKWHFSKAGSKKPFWLGYHLIYGTSNASSFESLGVEEFKDFGTGISVGRRCILYGNPKLWLEMGINYNLLLKEKYKKTVELPDMVSVKEVEIVDKYSVVHRPGGILNLIYKF